ncbi:CynX/NimT family MFS transporter [Pusillimonas sp.]|uniref:CynX/NimT family MFS transporter n=1 Tax=Pusillimonas sp. TaxID=3040095 RepID=UPI0037CBCD98
MQIMLLIIILYVGMNLRPSLVAVGPVISSIQSGLGLSGTSLGALLTLPVLCFGLFAPFAPRLLRRHSAEQIILVSLLALAAGIALRSLLGAPGLFAGTLLLGLAISVIMVLLPSLIKQHFPVQAGPMMGLYTTAIVGGAAIAAGVTIPLENWLNKDWRLSLAFWTLPALLAALIWTRVNRGGSAAAKPGTTDIPRLRGSWLAWQVTFFMGMQGAIAYCMFGWLPLILVDRGLSALNAGFVLSCLLATQIFTATAGPWIATRGPDQRPAIFVFLTMVLIGFLGLIYGPVKLIYLWASIFGLGFGGMFGMAMALLVLRSPNAQVAAAISGMSQGVGYVIAAVSPLIVGVLHEHTGNWNAAAVFLVLLILGGFWSGLLAGRPLLIEHTSSLPGRPVQKDAL